MSRSRFVSKRLGLLLALASNASEADVHLASIERDFPKLSRGSSNELEPSHWALRNRSFSTHLAGKRWDGRRFGCRLFEACLVVERGSLAWSVDHRWRWFLVDLRRARRVTHDSFQAIEDSFGFVKPILGKDQCDPPSEILQHRWLQQIALYQVGICVMLCCI
jgi:hypothetical protein